MKTIEIEFDEYPGDIYHVTVSPVPLSTFEKIHGLYPPALAGFMEEGSVDGIRALLAAFLPVAKPTVNGKATKLDMDPNLTFALIRQWHAGVRNVPLPLPRASTATAPSPRE